MATMMWNSPYAWQPPYGHAGWQGDYGYEGAPNPEDVPRPGPSPTPKPAPPPPPEQPTPSGSGTHRAGASPSDGFPPQQAPPQNTATGPASDSNTQAGGQGKGPGNPWWGYQAPHGDSYWMGAGKPMGNMGKGQPYQDMSMPYKGKGFAYQQYPTPKEDPVPTWDFENPGAKLRD